MICYILSDNYESISMTDIDIGWLFDRAVLYQSKIYKVDTNFSYQELQDRIERYNIKNPKSNIVNYLQDYCNNVILIFDFHELYSYDESYYDFLCENLTLDFVEILTKKKELESIFW